MFVVLSSAIFIAEIGMLMVGSLLCSKMSGRICENFWWLPWLREAAEATQACTLAHKVLVSSVVEKGGRLRGGGLRVREGVLVFAA